MKRNLTTLLVAALLSGLSTTVFAEGTECDAPAAPIIPDGNVASEDELVSAQKAIKMYQESLIGFRECLQEKTAALDPEAEGAADAEAAILEAFNASVDSENSVADEFNTAVRAYKERQPSK